MLSAFSKVEFSSLIGIKQDEILLNILKECKFISNKIKLCLKSIIFGDTFLGYEVNIYKEFYEFWFAA